MARQTQRRGGAIYGAIFEVTAQLLSPHAHSKKPSVDGGVALRVATQFWFIFWSVSADLARPPP